MKKTLIILLSFLACLSLVACDISFDKDAGEVAANLTQLPTPTISEVLNDCVYWEEVPNASSYLVKINSYQETAGNQLKYSISSVMDSRLEAGVPTELHIYVKAKGNQILYSDSEWSAEHVYTYTKKSSSRENTNGTYANSGVGCSVNVVAAKNYGDYIKGASVLNKELLKNDELFIKNENAKATQIKSASTQSIEDFVSENSVTIDVEVSNKSKYKTMFSNIDVGLHSSATFNYSSYSNHYYYSLDSYIERYSLYLNDYTLKSKYLDMFSNDYINTLSNLYNNQVEENFNNFFKTYGTHLIVSGIYGGRLNAYYSIVTNKATIDSSTSARLKLAVEAGISAVNNSTVKTDVSTSIHDVLKTSEVETAFYASAYGGNTFTATTLDGLNSYYTNWADSFNGSNYNPVLINYTSDGLIGLWDILPIEYSSMASSMESAFIEYYKNSYNTFINSFKGENATDYYLDANLLSCSHDNGYNYDAPDKNANNKHYSYDYEFGKFVIKNVGTRADDSFSLVGTNDASIYFRVTYDCDNLPLQDNMTSRLVNNDSFSNGFYDLPGGDIGNRQVKKGLLVVYISYDDGSVSTRIIQSNIFDGKKANDEILIADGIKKPCKVEIAICFEFTMWAPGFCGIVDDYWMDYRINKTVEFK